MIILSREYAGGVKFSRVAPSFGFSRAFKLLRMLIKQKYKKDVKCKKISKKLLLSHQNVLPFLPEIPEALKRGIKGFISAQSERPGKLLV